MKLQVINPNTNESMTRLIGEVALGACRSSTDLSVVSSGSGPSSIEGHLDDAIATVGMLERLREGCKEGYSAHVIACFGDPGLYAARELADGPVIGIAEAAFHMASLIATRFAVVTSLPRTEIITLNLLKRYDMATHCTSVRCVDLPVLALNDSDSEVPERLYREACEARDQEGAGAIILGCAGMARMAPILSRMTGMPVVEGISAAVKLCESLHDLGLGTSKVGDLAYPIPKPFSGQFEHFGAG